jgi:hypothetical protein
MKIISQVGLRDLNLTAIDITPQPQAQALAASPAQVSRPPKRPHAEIADSEDEDEGPGSDELYGWAEDDNVAAEGLLIFEQGPSATAAPHAKHPQGLERGAGRSEMPPG